MTDEGLVAVAKSARSWINRDFAWVAFQPATGSAHELRDEVEDAVSRVNELHLRQLQTDSNDGTRSPWGDVVVAGARHVFIRVTHGGGDERRAWLVALGEELAACGLRGGVVEPRQVFPPTPVLAYTQNTDTLATYVTLSGCVSERKRRQTSLRTDVDLFRELWRSLTAFNSAFGRPAATTYMANAASRFELPRDQALKAWASILASPAPADAGGLWFVENEGDVGEFSSAGHLCSYSDWISGAEWPSLVGRARSAMTVVASNVDLSFARYPHGPATTFTHQSPGAPAGSEVAYAFYKGATADLEHWIVDVHGLQVLTRSHLEKANDLSDFTVVEVAPDRFLVEAKDLEAWYAQPDPLPDALEAGRRAFGGAIITKDLAIERLNLHWPRENNWQHL